MMRFTGRRSKAAGVAATAAVAVGALVLWGSGGGTTHSAMKADLAGSDTACSPAGSLPITVGGVGGVLPAPGYCPGAPGVIAPLTPPTSTPTATSTAESGADPVCTLSAFSVQGSWSFLVGQVICTGQVDSISLTAWGQTGQGDNTWGPTTQNCAGTAYCVLGGVQTSVFDYKSTICADWSWGDQAGGDCKTLLAPYKKYQQQWSGSGS